MLRFAGALVAALTMSGVAVYSQAQAPVTAKPGTERITPQTQQASRNLMQDVSTVGCIRLWKPQPDDPTKMPPDRQPGLAGIYLLTPLASSPSSPADLPTYLLTPSATLNFSQNVGKRVEVTGTAQTAPLPPSVQEIATPAPRPEEKQTTNGMPRLTVTTMKVVADSCP
jgi:hypothetical protein